eukprot:m.227264 g.227264  ORF g.227264 m.227264 type:complete len:51 (-) comp15970_c2_seq3:694-846(-)
MLTDLIHEDNFEIDSKNEFAKCKYLNDNVTLWLIGFAAGTPGNKNRFLLD